ncbi:MAG: (Fe-S)-binding protein [Mariprofundaceae bacterium]
MSKLGWLYQKSGLHWLTTHTSLRYLVPASMRSGNESLPKIPKKRFGKEEKQIFPAHGEKCGTVALFTGCIMDHLFPHVHEATVRILTWNGYEVIVPGKQSCCGALHAHSGDIETADTLAREQLQLFGEIEADAIIVNAAGCSAQLKEYSRFSSRDRQALAAAVKVRDLTEFLASIELRPLERSLEMKVVYDDPCHLLHAQGISTAPRELISAIPGITLLPLPESDFCCGSAGSYSMTQSEMSLAILERKMEHISATGADAVITANPGCQIQLAWGAKRRKLPIEVLHIAELLDKVYGLNPDYSES